MNKIFTLLLVGALTAGAVTANAESQIFKEKEESKSGNRAAGGKRFHKE